MKNYMWGMRRADLLIILVFFSLLLFLPSFLHSDDQRGITIQEKEQPSDIAIEGNYCGEIRDSDRLMARLWFATFKYHLADEAISGTGKMPVPPDELKKVDRFNYERPFLFFASKNLKGGLA